MSWLDAPDAPVLGAVQGLTEFLPLSSSSSAHVFVVGQLIGSADPARVGGLAGRAGAARHSFLPAVAVAGLVG